MKFKNRFEVTKELATLDEKINSLLPPRYQHCYTDVSPDSMGSAGVKYGPDGKAAWDQIWTTFCDLALAGGPPHRGKLLEPATEAEIAANPTGYDEVVAEITRAIGLTTGLPVVNGYAPGWVGIRCESLAEAGWLQFAVTAENVSARRRENVLQLPAGPDFRVEKEIKNVVVALSKSVHYWDGHLSDTQQALVGEDIWEATTSAEAAENPTSHASAKDQMKQQLAEAGLPIEPDRYAGWVGIETQDDETAVWLLRAILVERVLVRREGKTLFFPVSATSNTDSAERAGHAFARAHALAVASAPRRFTR